MDIRIVGVSSSESCTISAEEISVIKVDLEDGDDVEVEMEDTVSSVLNMVNLSSASAVPPKQPRSHLEGHSSSEPEDTISKTDDNRRRSSDLFENLENNAIINDKDKETLSFSRQLETEKRARQEAEEKITKLVEFITCAHGEFGKMIKCLVSLTTKNLEVSNVLNVGPFVDEKETEEFLEALAALADQFLDDFENLGKTKNLLERITRILRTTSEEEDSTIPEDNEQEDNCQYSCAAEDQEIDNSSSISTLVMESETSDVASEKMPSSPQPPPTFGRKIKRSKKKKKAIASGRASKTPGQKLNNAAGKKHGVDHSRRNYCLCGLSYKNKATLGVHVKYYTMEWKFPCEFCNRRFLYASYLRHHMAIQHQIVDLAAPGFTCSRCGEEFSDRGTLTQHIQKNHGWTTRFGLQAEGHKKRAVVAKKKKVVPVPVAEATAKEELHGVDKSSSLIRCKCGNEYLHKTSLMIHISSKRHGKNFKCSFCPSRFSVHAELKIHVRTVHKTEYLEGKFGCPACGETFATREEWQLHRISEHPNNKEGPAKRRIYRRKPRSYDFARNAAAASGATASGPGSETVEDDEPPPVLFPQVFNSQPVTLPSYNTGVTQTVEIEDGIEIICID